MRILRRTATIGAVQAMLCWAVAQYVRLVWYTGRWRIVGSDAATARYENGEPLIVATWHGRILMVPYAWHLSDRTHILSSAHRDGQMISRVLSHFNMPTIAGSTGRGGAAALRRLHRILRNGQPVGITPDGPRGPRMRVSPGIIQLARLTGAPIFPLAYSARPRHVFDSWDRFVLPLPFAKGHCIWDQPMFVAADAGKAEMEAARRDLEDRLNALTQRADAELGLSPTEPAAQPGATEGAPAS